MPIDPNIILGVKPAVIQQQDPMDQYAKTLTLKNLMMQGQQTQQGLEDDTATREAYRQSAGDSKVLRSLLGERGQYKAIQALDKFNLETEGKRAEIDKNKQEILTKAVASHRDSLVNVNDPQTAAQWVAAGYQDPLLAPILSKSGTAEQAVARIPQDPAAFAQWKQQNALGATKFIELNKPHVQTQDLGGTSQLVSTPGLGGAPSVLSVTPKTITPGEAASDSRARALMAQNERHYQNPNLQHIDTQDGVVTFNPRTAKTAPLLGADGKPVQSGKGLTESQGKATGMALRAQTAHDILNELEDAGTTTPGIIKQGAAAVPLVGGALAMGVNTLPSVLGGPSSAQNRVEQAQRDFVNAALRVESGAAISESEFNNARKQYFGQPGDDAATLEQKRRNRETEIQNLKLQAGPGAKNVVSKPKAEKKAAGVDPSKLSDAEIKRELGI